MGHKMFVYAYFGLEGGTIKVGVDGEEITVLPRVGTLFGNDMMAFYCNSAQIDLVLTFHDIWAIPPDYRNCIPCKWAAMFPVDHDPLPQAVIQTATPADYRIVYSQFGVRVAEAAGMAVTYIPHAIDCETFDVGDKAEARKALRFPEDGYVMSMVAANKGYPARKNFPQVMQAFGQFVRDHKELNPYLYLHTDYSTANGGVHIPELARMCGVQDRILYVRREPYNAGQPDAYVAAVYVGSDVLLSPSATEGFGLPIIEAQSCGCPVIATNFSSMPELVCNGVLVEPAGLMWTQLNSWNADVHPEGIYKAMVEVATWPAAKREKMARLGRDFVVREYNMDTVAERYWKPCLEKIDREMLTGGMMDLVGFQDKGA